MSETVYYYQLGAGTWTKDEDGEAEVQWLNRWYSKAKVQRPAALQPGLEDARASDRGKA